MAFKWSFYIIVVFKSQSVLLWYIFKTLLKISCQMVLYILQSVQPLVCKFLQKREQAVAIKVITKKNLSKAQNLLTKEINILKVS